MKIKQKIISKIAESMVITVTEPPHEAVLSKPLNESRVAFVTTSGVLLKNQEPFNCKDGDTSYRIIPGDVSFSDLTVSHTHYDIKAAMENKNIVFPLEHLRSMAEKGIIKEVAPKHFGLMGYIPDVETLQKQTAIEIADILQEDQVDIVLLSPG